MEQRKDVYSFCKALREMGVVDIFTRRSHGNMKFDGGKEAAANRRYIAHAFAPHDCSLAIAGCPHGSRVELMRKEKPEEIRLVAAADALIALEPGALVGVTYADCPPVFLVDPGKRLAAAVHCGWKPFTQGVLAKTAGMLTVCGSDPYDWQVLIGPGICRNCFEFGAEAPEIFDDYPGYFTPRSKGKYLVNLKGMIIRDLKLYGVQPEKIQNAEFCTKTSADLFFSARHDRTLPVEAGMALIGFRN